MTTTVRELATQAILAAKLPEHMAKLTAKAEGGPLAAPIAQGNAAAHADMVQACRAATAAFETSAVGQRFAQEVFDMTPEAALEAVKDVFALPEIAALSDFATAAPSPKQDEGDGVFVEAIEALVEEFLPQTVVLQLSLILEIEIGVEAYVGFAVQIGVASNVMMYAGIAGGVGISNIVGAGQGVGLSSNPYTGMNGLSAGCAFGGAVNAGVLADFSTSCRLSAVFPFIQPNYTDWTIVGYFLEGVGEDAGIYVGFAINLANESIPNMYQPRRTYQALITDVECLHRQDGTSQDEIFLIVTIDGAPTQFRYPNWDYFSINDDGIWSVGMTINFDSYFTVGIYETDETDIDTIGTWTVHASDLPTANDGTTHILNCDYNNGWNTIEYNVYLRNVGVA